MSGPNMPIAFILGDVFPYLGARHAMPKTHPLRSSLGDIPK